MPEIELTSNIDDVSAWLDKVVASVNFEMHGTEESLGRDLASAVAEGIQLRTEQEKRDADGGPLKPNEVKYAARKERDYDIAANTPAVRTGQTLSLVSLLGQTNVSRDIVQMTYGTDEPPTRTRSGGWKRPKLREADQRVTDREKAQFLEEQGRPFYALDEEIVGRCVELCQDAVERLLRS